METTSAILLRKTKLTETSLIVTWLTAEHGLMKTVAKGARRPKSPFAGRLDLFFTCEIAVARSLRSDLHALREAAVRDSREGLRSSYNRTRTAAYFVELIELTTEADQPAAEAFDLLRRAFDYLAANEPSRRAVLHFENQLARILGVLGENNAHVEPATAIARLAGHELPAVRGQLLKSLRPAPEDSPVRTISPASPAEMVAP